LARRAEISSAVTARLRAASGTAPVTVTACRPSVTVSAAASPARTAQEKRTGTMRRLPVSYAARAAAKSSLGSGASAGRTPNICAPGVPRQ
jgi:hypothetical protein